MRCDSPDTSVRTWPMHDKARRTRTFARGYAQYRHFTFSAGFDSLPACHTHTHHTTHATYHIHASRIVSVQTAHSSVAASYHPSVRSVVVHCERTGRER